jgi:hypothetical protein
MYTMALSFTESADSLTLEQRIAQLEKKVDSLQVSFAKYSIKKDTDTLLKSDKFINWGRGTTVQMYINGMNWGFEAGYTFVTNKFLRMGLLYGAQILLNDTTLPRGAFYGKTSLGTPVFLNFISINTYFKLFVFPAGSNFHFHIPEHTRGGAAVGIDFGFWMTPHIAIIAGACQTIGLRQFLYNNYTQLGAQYTFGKSNNNINRLKTK